MMKGRGARAVSDPAVSLSKEVVMTSASGLALKGLRDLSTLQWYVIPLLAIVFYIYTSEIKKARETGNWDAVFAGLTLFGADFLYETINGWIFHITRYSALWTTPGPTALRTTVGWNIEIMFMFSIAGIIYYNTLSSNRSARILGIPDGVFWAFSYAAFCVFVECLLNIGGLLVWEYPFWKLSPLGVLPVFFIAYFPCFLTPFAVIRMKSNRSKVKAVSGLYLAAGALNIIALGFLGWNY
jgi:hypothetical protein